jgi:hypothetical protein
MPQPDKTFHHYSSRAARLEPDRIFVSRSDEQKNCRDEFKDDGRYAFAPGLLSGRRGGEMFSTNRSLLIESLNMRGKQGFARCVSNHGRPV